MEKIVRLSAAVAIATTLGFAQEGRSVASASTPVSSVSFESMRVMEIAKRLAQTYHVVIGVSGLCVGPNNRLVSVTVSRGSIKDVLDAAVTADPKFTWHENRDGTNLMAVNGASLGVLD